MPHYRKITVDDKEYEYHVGRSGVKIKGFDFVNMSEWTGWDWSSLERASWKSGTPSICPANIALYIKYNLLSVTRHDVREMKPNQDIPNDFTIVAT